MKILVSDDQTDVLEAIRLLLKGAGHQTEIVDSPKAVLAAVERGPFDLVLMDMNYSRDTTSGDEGMALLDRLLARDATVPDTCSSACCPSTPRHSRPSHTTDGVFLPAKSVAITTIFSSSVPDAWECCSPTSPEKEWPARC